MTFSFQSKGGQCGGGVTWTQLKAWDHTTRVPPAKTHGQQHLSPSQQGEAGLAEVGLH